MVELDRIDFTRSLILPEIKADTKENKTEKEEQNPKDRQKLSKIILLPIVQPVPHSQVMDNLLWEMMKWIWKT